MSSAIQSVLIALIPSLLTAAVAAFLSAKLTLRYALREFRSKEWWQKKAEAYSQIIEHLTFLQLYFEEQFDNAIRVKSLGNPEKADLEEGYRQARIHLGKAAASGGFIVKEEASKAVMKLFRDFQEVDRRLDVTGYFDECNGLVRDCITRVRDCGKADLGLTEHS